MTWSLSKLYTMSIKTNIVIHKLVLNYICLTLVDTFVLLLALL